jgi:hypothetical protein
MPFAIYAVSSNRLFAVPRTTFKLRSLFALVTVCAAVFAVIRWAAPAWPQLVGLFVAITAITWFWHSNTGRKQRRSRKGIALFLLVCLAISWACLLVVELILMVVEQFGLLPTYN